VLLQQPKTANGKQACDDSFVLHLSKLFLEIRTVLSCFPLAHALQMAALGLVSPFPVHKLAALAAIVHAATLDTSLQLNFRA